MNPSPTDTDFSDIEFDQRKKKILKGLLLKGFLLMDLKNNWILKVTIN